MERIHVTVRARPLSPEDAKTSQWRISGNSISISNHSSIFEFDQIFGEDRKTVEVYQERIRDIVTAAVRGFNGTVFAYGQTNSGKTHTMRGLCTEPGVIPLAIHDLFDIIQEDMDREFLLRMSYMEIYNEEINDLLAPEHRKLQIHESLERGIFVAGLREEIVASSEQVHNFMEFGESHRHIGETNMNLHSSRSHTIFRMIIESREKTEDENIGGSCDAVRVSVLNLVDLAGSERAAKTGAEGVRLKEGSHINKSLMTLGTVIKKLSEGAESQGGHVPYRDSKLTRILQPALGGNANTAIICNITLAQIHTDETKSSLQFASRALRVTNCAHVNEILTDAALLKRQKKEIEELRSKLQGSHSEHLEVEILNLRNTLLQIELERERIALELEEEKKAQAEREKRLQEQAKKIENLSSMVLYSNRDENRDPYKKGKRRDTWCPGNLMRETVQEEYSSVHSKPSSPIKPKRCMGPLLHFEELMNESKLGVDVQECSSNIAVDDCTLPDSRALLHVTNRRKVPIKKKSFVENDELTEMRVEYEDLLLASETQRTMYELQIDCLTEKLAEANLFLDSKFNDHTKNHLVKITSHWDKGKGSRDSEAIFVIKQLQDKINMLEMEKFSGQKNLDHISELATEQNICARENYEEEENLDSMIKQEIVSEVQKSRYLVDNLSFVLDELFQSFSAILNFFLDLKTMTSQNFVQIKSIFSNHEKLQLCMQQKVTQVETDKLLLDSKSVDLQRQIEEIKLDAQNFEQAMRELSEHHDLEKLELFSHIKMLEKEISHLSSCSLAKEKEILRRDLDKTKVKLKETESKLKNAIQEKTKLEGEKAYFEREVKQLHSQRMLLERDISKRDSLAGRRRDSFADKSSKACDLKKAKGHTVPFEQTILGENKELEVLTFEMETTITSLEEELATAYGAKEEAISRNELLASELAAVSDQLKTAHSDLNVSQKEVLGLKVRLEESESRNQKREWSINLLEEEKEEFATQLTNALLEMEEEKVIWSAKEKASVEAIEEKAKSFNAELTLLSNELLEVTNELESCRKQCKKFEERLVFSEENSERENKHSIEKSLEIDSLRNDLQKAVDESRRSQENFGNQLSSMTKERDKLIAQIGQQGHATEVENLENSHENEVLEAKVEELTKRIFSMEIMMHNVEVGNSKEKAKVRMRLHWTQVKLDAFRRRHKEAIDELDFMQKKYQEASGVLKDRLASYGIEVINLKKQLAAAKEQ